MLENCYVALPSDPSQKKVSGSKMAPPKESLSLKHRHIEKKIKINLLQNRLVQILEIWYVALPNGSMLSLFK